MARRLLRFIKTRPWVTIIFAAILPGTCASVVEYFLTSGVSGQIPIIAAISGGSLAAMLIVVLYLLKAHDRNGQLEAGEPVVVREVIREIPVEELDENTRQSTFPDSDTEERIFSPRTPAELVGEIAGMTTMVAERHSERHIGQWLRIEGLVDDVSSHYKEIRISIHKTEALLFLSFDESRWGSRLLSLNVGDNVVAIGRIDSIRLPILGGEGGSVFLKECELID